jgi:sec-independent protein translocase protein TatA
MPSLGPWELAIILLIIVIIFGVGTLPEIGGALGKGIKEFRTSASDLGDDKNDTKADVTTNKPVKEEL